MKKFLVIMILISFICGSAYAIYAPRPMGMGGAYTAIADDAFAAYWNPAGFAVNPGIDLSSSYQMTNRNQLIGDNSFALKACLETEMNPFAWVLGIGLATMFAYEGAHYLADEGIIKKGWGREGTAVKKEESMAESVQEEEEEKIAAGEEIKRTPISKKEIAKKVLKEAGKATLAVGKKVAKFTLEEIAKESARQTRHYYYAPYWYRPNYYRPNYWDDRYDYREKELTPAGKAQFGGGLTIMSDKNQLLDQDTNWYSFSFASGYAETVLLGANINIYDLKIKDSSGSDLRGFGAGLDVGGLVRIQDALFFGLAVKELLTTDIKFENGSIRRYQMSVNAGAAIKPVKWVTIAADANNIFEQYNEEPSMHYGIEVRPIYGVALRAGLSDNELSKQNKTAGISIGIEQLIIDYAYLGGSYNRTQMLGVTWKI